MGTNGIFTHGLKPISIHYLQTIREIILDKTPARIILKNRIMTDLYLTQTQVLKPFFELVINSLLKQKEKSNSINVSLKYKIIIAGILLDIILTVILAIFVINTIMKNVL